MTSPDLASLNASALCRCVDRVRAPLVAQPDCLGCRGTGVRNRVRDRVLANNARRRVPTMAEFLAFRGDHCHRLYAQLPQDWCCPGCARTKFQILRWTRKFPGKPHAHMGWAGGYHEHHDHGGDARQFRGRFGRFAPTVICEQCNNADTAAKRTLGLPRDFSFSPTEIRQFVVGSPHGDHLIDYDIARDIYARWQALAPPMFF
ncbi:hypothetical protein [Cupriavidus sp. TMH.W2]|uniref:hypothetical protein n=1 Tax=Cupriavidus sp. TMH.W2 TaxID=3434465 RepID=UPI003D77E70A